MSTLKQLSLEPVVETPCMPSLFAILIRECSKTFESDQLPLDFLQSDYNISALSKGGAQAFNNLGTFNSPIKKPVIHPIDRLISQIHS